MPVAAVAGAAIAIGIAAEVGTTLAIIGAVGATVGAIGAITGVKELQIAGTVIGAVGAIGGLAQGAGLIGELGTFGSQAGGALAETAAATSIAESASPFMSAGDSIASEIAQWSTYGATGGDFLSGAPIIGGSTDNGTFDVVNMVNGQTTNPGDLAMHTVVENASAPDVTPSVAQMNDPGGVQMNAETGLISQGDSTPDVMSQPQGSVFNQPKPTAPAAPATPPPPTPEVVVQATPPVTGAPANPLDAGIPGSYNASVNAALKTGSAPMDGGGWWKDIMSFIGKPGVSTLASGVVQAGGAFISGATSQLTPAQIEALRAQAQANVAASNLSTIQGQVAQTQANNIGQPLPVARRVTGQPAGLINGGPVTGQV